MALTASWRWTKWDQLYTGKLISAHEALGNRNGNVSPREKLTHSNPVFNENGTFTYTANRTAIFLPELNTIDPNTTVVMPNLGVLVSTCDKSPSCWYMFSRSQLIPSYLHDAPFFTKIAVNLMMRSLKSEPFIRTTIHSYLWNVTDPLLDIAQSLAPNLVPTKNVGILNKVGTTKSVRNHLIIYTCRYIRNSKTTWPSTSGPNLATRSSSS